MSTTQQPEALRLADALAYCDASVASQAAAELRRLHADVEHKDKYAEQLGRELAAADAEARSLRTGYAAARLEIESLRAAQSAAQPGADERRLRRILCARYEFLPYMDDGEAQGQKLDWLRCTVDQIEARILEVDHERFLASAAAQPAAEPGTAIGDSAFESWYSSYNPTHKGDKQRARDAYAAGMGDSLVMAAPAAVAGPSEMPTVPDSVLAYVHTYGDSRADEDGLSGMRVSELILALRRWAKSIAAAPTTQPAPNEDEGISREQWIEQAMRVYLIAGDTEQQAEECAKYMWGELDMDDLADPYDAAMSDVEGRGPAPQSSPAAQVDALDAARLDWLRDNSCDLRCVDSATGQGDGDIHWIVIEHHMTAPVEREIGRAYRDDPRAAIDAARARMSPPPTA